MQEKKDGNSYAPKGKSVFVCAPHSFRIGIVGIAHGHIYGMCNGVTEAGAEVALIYDPDPAKIEKFLRRFPETVVAHSAEEVYNSDVQMILSSAIASHRAEIGIAAMEHGKDFFADKPSITTMRQLSRVRETISHTGRKFYTYFSERLHVEASVLAGQLIEEGVIGKVVQVMGWGPHRLSADSRPEWFFDKEEYGGILTDIGCHQIEQLLYFSGARDGKIIKSRRGNVSHPQYPNFEDLGDCMLQCANGVPCYFRVDWFTPDGLGSWGDGRVLIVGTEGYLEIRKYINLAEACEGDHIYYANGDGEHHICAEGTCGYPFFGEMILDCMNRTENAMSQEYILRVMELAIEAEENAEIITEGL